MSLLCQFFIFHMSFHINIILTKFVSISTPKVNIFSFKYEFAFRTFIHRVHIVYVNVPTIQRVSYIDFFLYKFIHKHSYT